MNIENIKSKLQSLEKQSNVLDGKVDLLSEQLDNLISTTEDKKQQQILNAKAIELMNYIQQGTKETIVQVFENIVTKALHFIHQSEEYKFELEFGQRGNLPELKFSLKTPDMQESHDIMSTRAGGSKDIIALALRFVLLEISKSSGFLFLDEPEKRLDDAEQIEKMIEFIKELQKDTKRQVIIITHKEEMIEAVDNPIILVKKQMTQSELPIKKKRARKSKVENENE